MLQSIKPKTWTILLYLLIPVVAFVFTVFYPLCRAVIYSFFEWKGGPNMTFNWLANYRQLFADGVFWQAFWHNIYLVVVCIIGQMGLAFILVMFANSRLTHAKGVHRTFGFFPSTISAVCIGMIWNIIYLQDGLLNRAEQAGRHHRQLDELAQLAGLRQRDAGGVHPAGVAIHRLLHGHHVLRHCRH